MVKAWDYRCRKWYGDRYDFRRNMVGPAAMRWLGAWGLLAACWLGARVAQVANEGGLGLPPSLAPRQQQASLHLHASAW